MNRIATVLTTVLLATLIPSLAFAAEGGIAAGDGSYYSTGAALMLQAAWYR